MPCVNPPKGLATSKDCCRPSSARSIIRTSALQVSPSSLDFEPPHPCCQRLEARTAGRRIHHGPGLRVGGGGCSTGRGRDGCPSGGGWRDFGGGFRAPMLFLVIALLRFMHQKFQLASKSLGILQAWTASGKGCNGEALETLGFHVVKFEVKFRANGRRGHGRQTEQPCETWEGSEEYQVPSQQSQQD